MPSPVGGLGACPQKKKILRQKLCNSEQVLVLLSYITAESGGLSPSPESGGLIPCLPPVPTPMTSVSMFANMITQKKPTRPIYTKFGGKVANGPRKNNCWIFMVIRITLYWGLGYTEVSK